MRQGPGVSLVRVGAILAALAQLLVACADRPADSASRRLSLAQQEDALAKCGLLAEQPGFREGMKACAAFAETDRECAVFPEEKEGCQAFLHAPNYADQRLHCKKFNFQVKNCKDLVAETDQPHPLLKPLLALIESEEPDDDAWLATLKGFDHDILIGVVDSGYAAKGSFFDGIKLAVAEVNAEQGVFGRDITLLTAETGGDLDRSRSIAEEMAANLAIRIVIGRQFSVNTIPVTPIYDRESIVYITVSSVMRNVIRHGSRYSFRLVPDSATFAAALAKYATGRGYTRVAVLYSRDDYNEEMAYAFRDFAVNQGMTIPYEKSFFEDRGNFPDIGAEMLEREIDAIFLSTYADAAVELVKTLRGMGLDAPVIGSDALDSQAFAADLGSAGTDIVVPTIYNPFSKRPENTAFVERFRREYGYRPGTRAAQGYDVIKLLAHTMENEAGSTVPSSVATTLRHMVAKSGAVGQIQFGNDGELVDPVIYIKELQNGEFVLFKDRRKEEEQSMELNIVNGKVVHRPDKPAESTEAMGIR